MVKCRQRLFSYRGELLISLPEVDHFLFMNVLILPGYSASNLDWLLWLKEKLGRKDVDVVHWRHWTSEPKEVDWTLMEAENIISYLSHPTIVIAKSLGTLVLMKMLASNSEFISGIVLLGIPINDLSAQDKKYYDVLRHFPVSRVLSIQNVNDNHGAYENVRSFVQSINSQISPVSMPRDDHSYPYVTEILEFINKLS